MKPKFKIETVEEFKARGGKVKKVNFKNAHNKYSTFGRNFKDYRNSMVNNLAKSVKTMTRKSG